MNPKTVVNELNECIYKDAYTFQNDISISFKYECKDLCVFRIHSTFVHVSVMYAKILKICGAVNFII